MKKSVFSRVLSLLLAGAAAFAWACPTRAAGPSVSARSAVVIEAESGRILYEKDARTAGGIASTTKIMTALVVLERMNPDRMVCIRPEYTGIEGSSMYLKAGERMTVRSLLYGMLLVSGNDAATALACCTAGSVERFAALMNEKAAQLGLETAHFCNPHGLDAPGHGASALDLARIAAAAMQNETFAEIVASRPATAAGRTLVNHNKLLWLYDGVCGVKTGYTKSTGRSLVSCCERGGVRLICVTLGAPDDWNDHMYLYDSVWNRYERRTVVRAGEVLARLPAVSAQVPAIPVRAAADVVVFAAPEEQTELCVHLPEFLYGGVPDGKIVGTVQVRIGDAEVGRTELAVCGGVPQDGAQRAGFAERLVKNLRLIWKGARGERT